MLVCSSVGVLDRDQRLEDLPVLVHLKPRRYTTVCSPTLFEHIHTTMTNALRVGMHANISLKVSQQQRQFCY